MSDLANGLGYEVDVLIAAENAVVQRQAESAPANDLQQDAVHHLSFKLVAILGKRRDAAALFANAIDHRSESWEFLPERCPHRDILQSPVDSEQQLTLDFSLQMVAVDEHFFCDFIQERVPIAAVNECNDPRLFLAFVHLPNEKRDIACGNVSFSQRLTVKKQQATQNTGAARDVVVVTTARVSQLPNYSFTRLGDVPMTVLTRTLTKFVRPFVG
ncbi:MAG: hypothetical protein WBD31_22165 [Rubripirellula sp.]